MNAETSRMVRAEVHSETRASFQDLFRQEDEALDLDKIKIPSFAATDIVNPSGLASQLCLHADPLSSFLWAQIPEEIQTKLQTLLKMSEHTHGLASDITNELKARLVECLNQVLGKNSIYTKERFAKVPLGKATEEVLKLDPKGAKVAFLNRRLLEDAYPDCLQKHPDPWKIQSMEHIDEPWVAFTAKDRVGLALSGGGIRSATFNLGILQALHRNQVLNRLSYFATVSGGGYIGGFWTRWWHAHQGRPINMQKADCQKEFPPGSSDAGDPLQSGPEGNVESREFRHLREFSRFLIPRQGLNTEFWSAASTILTGFIPSLITAMAAILLLMLIWLFFAIVFIQQDIWEMALHRLVTAGGLSGISMAPWYSWGTGLVFAVSVLLFLFAADAFTYHTGRSEVIESMHEDYKTSYGIWSVLAFITLLAIWGTSIAAYGASGDTISFNPIKSLNDSSPYLFNLPVFWPSIALFFTLPVLTLLRLLWDRIRECFSKQKDSGNESAKGVTARLIASSAAHERVVARVLAVLVIWAVLAGVWEIARCLHGQAGAKGFKSTGGVGGVTAVLGFLFYLVRHWLTQPKGDKLDLKFMSRLKPFVPQILANCLVLLLFVLAAVFILGSLQAGQMSGLWIPAIICLITAVLTLPFFNPAKFGLHEFYRARLTRCYLGASQETGSREQSNGNSPDNRIPVERPDDDMYLYRDSGRPIHLICCAANHLWGDPLSTLHRGARSAVLSRFGISLGNDWITDVHLRLSSALTASAAALNSLMGELNLQVGRAVSFIMTAMNLRLGLWVKNPAYRHGGFSVSDTLPGLLFVREMLGCARCNTDKNATAYIHLSDGGHFENLALYELIRRHCRYIIVSDAGEDREFAFTDFGRASRRVREDFGVEIEIDLTPIRQNSQGKSQQHIAVGTIHYDGVGGMDKGVIVYFKPTLTGDEPVDVLQYHQRKPAFPHESTMDQFFDEAQFESYRRLGEHTINDSLRMLERSSSNIKKLTDETLFRNVRLHWYRVPWMQGDAGIRLCKHAADLEDALRDKAGAALRKEFIGDIFSVVNIPMLSSPIKPASEADKRQPETSLPTDAQSDRTPVTEEQIASDILMAIRVFKFMEEAWVICDLERYSSHPLAQSWMSYLHRWAAAPTMKKWWPVLRPMFGRDFQAFANTKLYLQPAQGGESLPSAMYEFVKNRSGARLYGFAWRRLKECYPDFKLDGRMTFGLELKIPFKQGCDPLKLQVGLAIIGMDKLRGLASWGIGDLFVPPELSGGGFHSQLLDSLIDQFKNNQRQFGGIHRLDVIVEAPRPDTSTRLPRSQAERQERLERIDFYRSRGFAFDRSHGPSRCMFLTR